MPLAVLALIVLQLLPLLLWVDRFWNIRRILVLLVAALQIVLTVLVWARHPSAWAVAYSIVALYQLFNYARIAAHRMQAAYLRRVTHRTALFLTPLQLLLMLVSNDGHLHLFATVYALVTLEVAGGIVLLLATSRHLRTTKTLQATTHYTDAALPSISVLVPARNETEELQSAIKALTASDYPKLEIIVLDDCSQNKRTPEIIRSFAHDGVHFLAGEVPGDNWLAKNFAYQQLADAASGDYLVFCGADVEMSVGALRELITTMLEKNKTMVSILPTNVRPRGLLAHCIQPFRYGWELSLPRRLLIGRQYSVPPG